MRCCEAMIRIEHPYREVWTRCGRSPVERHHRLTRARGGAILDKVGETYHLIDLCPAHHRMADGAVAYQNGLLLDGYVTTSVEGEPVYVGSDPYLTELYGPVPMWDLRELEGDPGLRQRLRDTTREGG